MFLSSSGKGILITVLALLATALVLVLVKVSTLLKQSGHFDVVCKRIGLLDSKEARFALRFENESKSDKELLDWKIGYAVGKKVTFLCGMAYAPIARGTDLNFVRGKEGHYGFFLEKGCHENAVVDFLLPNESSLPENCSLCFCCQDSKGRLLYAPFSFENTDSQLLTFRKAKQSV